MAWKKIWSVAKGPNEVRVEQDERTGNMLVKANIVELTPDEASEMAVAMTTAAFPFVKSSRHGRPEDGLADTRIEMHVGDDEIEINALTGRKFKRFFVKITEAV